MVENLTEPEIQKLLEKDIEEAQNNFQEYHYYYSLSSFKFLSTSNDMDNLTLTKLSTSENSPSPSNRFCSNHNKNYFNEKEKCDDCDYSIVSKANIVEDKDQTLLVAREYQNVLMSVK